MKKINLTPELKQKYIALRHFLKRQQWQLADLKTRELMLAITGANERQDILLTEQDLKEFSCIHLQTIDQLWLKYSQKKFGFTIIAQIYSQENKDYFKLAEKVGWYHKKEWIKYDNINYNNNAPIGHLPLTWLIPTTFGIFWSARFASAGWRRMLDRVEKCASL